jgi:predicted MFS family arabinose efflux permease
VGDRSATADSADVPAPALAGRRLLVGILSVGAFTTALNITLLSPLLVDIAEEFAVSEAAAGQLATLTAASSGLTAIAVAPWMDRYSRRFWLRFECSLLVLGSLLSALAPGFGWMFLGRAVAGIGGAVIGATCLAACADLFADVRVRNRALGLINSAFTLGAVFGLPVITLVADWSDWRWAIALPAPLALLVFAGSSFLPGRAVAPLATDSLWRAWADGYRRVLASRETLWLLAAEIGFMVVWFGWLIYFGAFAETVFAVGAAMLSALFLVGGAAEMVGNNLAPVLLRRWSARAIGYAGIAVAAVNLLLVGVAYDQRWTLFPFIAIGSVAGAVLFICVSIALLDSLPSARGAVMSLQSACLELGGALGVAVTGLGLALLDDYEAVYRLLGLVMPVVALCLFVSGRRRTRDPDVEVDVRPQVQPADG